MDKQRKYEVLQNGAATIGDSDWLAFEAKYDPVVRKFFKSRRLPLPSWYRGTDHITTGLLASCINYGLRWKKRNKSLEGDFVIR